MVIMRKCYRCKRAFPLEEFKRTKIVDGYCRKCRKSYYREYSRQRASKDRREPYLNANKGKMYTTKELAYICYNYKNMPLMEIAEKLGRTRVSILGTYKRIKDKGQVDYFRYLYHQY